MKSHVKTLGILLAASLAGSTALVAAAPTTNAPAAKAPAPTGQTSKIDDLFPDPVIAKGKGFEIKRSQLDEAISGIKSRAAASRQQITAADMPIIEKTSFDRLLQVELLKAKATDADKAAGKVEADKRFALISKRAPSEEALTAQLKAMNMTIAELHKRLLEEAVAEQVLVSKVKITDADIKKFYDENPSKFEEPEMVRASHILISTQDPSGQPLSDEQIKAKRKIADDLLKRARAGEDFAKLAKEYSDDPGSKDKGGEYKFPRGQMVPEFESAAFSLRTNQISEIVTTKFGFHIIKLSEKIPAKKADLAEVKPEIKNYLESKEVAQMLPAYYIQLKKDADVQIMDPELKKLEDTDLTPPARQPGGPALQALPK
jgi:parvulin-like peptidyl-prolyl isomerase